MPQNTVKENKTASYCLLLGFVSWQQGHSQILEGWHYDWLLDDVTVLLSPVSKNKFGTNRAAPKPQNHRLTSGNDLLGWVQVFFKWSWFRPLWGTVFLIRVWTPSYTIMQHVKEIHFNVIIYILRNKTSFALVLQQRKGPLLVYTESG